MKNIAAFFVTVLGCGTLAAAIFGGAPYEKWENGGYGYLVLGNSLIADQEKFYGEGTNKQGDTCLESSSDTLTAGGLPIDAVVTKAYLVWTGAVGNFEEPTDNTVTFSFTREDGYIYENEIVGGESPKMLDDTSAPFLFESVRFYTAAELLCTTSVPGQKVATTLAYFTYRVDVTDFFKKIIDDNHAEIEPVMDGQALLGDYRVGGLDCQQEDQYRCATLMVSNWVLVIIYQSAEVAPKNIYLYPGFSMGQQERKETLLTGLSLPYKSALRMTMVTAEGDPVLMAPTPPSYHPINAKEMVFLKGAKQDMWRPITADCDPEDDALSEVWDSRPAFFAYDAEKNGYCTTYGDTYTFGLDIDNWYLDTASDEALATLLPEGGDSVGLALEFGLDEVLTNLLILSVDKKYANFDIPGKKEKDICSCRTDDAATSAVCQDRPYYYLIKVQNWGDDTAHDVMVIDDPEACGLIGYVPNSTEMATQFDENGNGTDWTPIFDGPGGECPLKGDGFKVADAMPPCDINTMTCPETRLIRFKVKPSGIPNNCVIQNLAYIKEAASEIKYATNTNVPLTSPFGECKPIEECPEPPKSECGGGEETPANDNDAITGADEDAVITDEPATDDTTAPDTDTKKDGGGCALVVF